ncbi:MAG TPA: hypothetical protein VGX69_12375 [Solirubrobacteraceae bacterium]|jgi:ABC-type multidrug transport system fused ATPase/permease subunit|nr:hypothetical protein [Solirubrobacteraceae bacterium]
MSASRSDEDGAFPRWVHRLAPYRPFELKRRDRRIGAVVRQLILAAAHAKGGGFTSCAECQMLCRGLWGLEIEREEIRTAIEQLLLDGDVIRKESRIVLSEACGKELAERVRSFNEVEAAAFAEWTEAISEAVPTLNDEDLNELSADLVVWLNQIIVQYGITASVLLYPEREHFKRRLAEVRSAGFEELPERSPTVMMVRPAALRSFVEHMSEMQRRYFDNMLITAHLMSIFTLDPQALESVRVLTSGQRLYIDSNVVYSILKLDGMRKYYVTSRILDLSQKLGYEICVTPWTVAETQRSIRTARDRLLRVGPSPQSLSGLAPSDPDRGSYEKLKRVVRKLERDRGISPHDFFALHEQVEPLLSEQGVAVVDEGCKLIDGEEGAFDEEISAFERVRRGAEKPRPLQEHDVKHRLLIKHLRGDRERRFSNAHCLLLTDDQALALYARTGMGMGEGVPFAVTVTEWGHIVRSLYPRTEDYERTIEEIGGTPALRSAELVSQEEVIDAIKRVNTHDHYSQAIGTRVLLDSAFVDGRDGQDEAGATDDGTVEDEPGESALETRVIFELLEQLNGMQQERTRERAEYRSRVVAERRARLELEQRLKRKSREVTEQAQGGLEERRNDSEAEFAYAKRLLRLEHLLCALIASLIALAGLAALIVPLSLGWITSGWPLIADILAGGALLIGALSAWLGWGWKRVGQFVTLAALLLGLVASLRTLVPEDSSSKAGAVKAPQAGVSATHSAKPPSVKPSSAAKLRSRTRKARAAGARRRPSS